MNTVSGVIDCEFNPSATEDVYLLQIWMVSNIADATSTHQKIHISTEDKCGKIHLNISKHASKKRFSIQKDINMYTG